jgi:hypothetical protein
MIGQQIQKLVCRRPGRLESIATRIANALLKLEIISDRAIGRRSARSQAIKVRLLLGA